MATPQRYQGLPTFWPRDRLEEHIRKICQSVNGILKGQANNVYEVTLEAGETETEVNVENAHADSQVFFAPRSAAAAAALSSIWAEPARGKVTIHHDADPSTNRKLSVAIFG